MPENDIDLLDNKHEPALAAEESHNKKGATPDSATATDNAVESTTEDEIAAPAQDRNVPVREEQDSFSDHGEQLSLSIPEPEEETCDEDSDDTPESGSDRHSILDAAPPYDPEKPRKADVRFDFIELLILTLTVVFVLTSFVFRHSIVDGDSMMNTLHDKDALIISDLFYTPKQYDIVVIEDHSTGLDHPLVKRVIAVGGDTVRITRDTVYVNDEPVRDDFVYTGDHDGVYEYDPATWVVPEGDIFVLGDHRNDSLDSRAFGSVSVDAVIGRVLFRFYPFSDFGTVYTEED